MKKLNKKGFTLIELLAVIVILAIIVVVTVPTILNSIEDARLSSIHSLSREIANQYDTAVAQDLIATDPALGNAAATSEWKCIESITDTSAANKGNLANILDLSDDDLSLGTTAPSLTTNGELILTSITKDTCSAIRVNANGAAEVLLVADEEGKFAISGEVVYGLSSDTQGRIVETEENNG